MSSVTDIKKLLNTVMKDAVAFIGDEQLDSDVTGRASTGIAILDLALTGGLPLGRIVEIYGEQGAGKSTLAMHTIKEFQIANKDGVVIYADAERTFDKKRAESIGVDLKRLVVIYPETIESCSQMVIEALKSQQDNAIPLLIVIDTLVTLLTQKETEAKYAGGIQDKARTIRAEVAKYLSPLAKSQALLIVINHLIASMNPYQKADSSGGSAVKFWSSVRISCKKSGFFTDPATGKTAGSMMKCKVEKNKVARPLLEVEVPITYAYGVDNDWALFNYLYANDKIRRGGSWYYIVNPENNQEVKFQTKSFKETVAENPWMIPHMTAVAEGLLKDG